MYAKNAAFYFGRPVDYLCHKYFTKIILSTGNSLCKKIRKKKMEKRKKQSRKDRRKEIMNNLMLLHP